MSNAVYGLWAATILFAIISVLQFNAASSLLQFNDLAQVEFDLSIGFVFAFGAVATLLAGVFEYRAEKRQEELKTLLQGRQP